MVPFVHNFIPSPSGSNLTLLGLHGTGGDESEILGLLRAIHPDASLLAPRGKSTDEGVNRYFRRLSEGVFDMADLVERTEELAEWVEWARTTYGLQDVVAVGYSNGANIGSSLLFARPSALQGLIGLRGMTAFVDEEAELSGKNVLLINGQSDPIVPHGDATGLALSLRKAGASVQHEWLATGHHLTQQDVLLSRDWLGKQG